MYLLSDTKSALSLVYLRFTKLFDKYFPQKKLNYNTTFVNLALRKIQNNLSA